MLKELLPISKIKEKVRNLQKRSNTTSEQDFSVSGANLLNDSDSYGQNSLDSKDPRSYYETPAFVKITQVTILGLTVAFLVLSVANVILSSRIKKQRSVVVQKAQKLAAVVPVLEELDSVASKVSLLKEQKNSSEDLSSYVELFLDSSNHFNFQSFKLNSSLATFTATTSSPISFSLAAENYLESGLVKDIILTSASLDQEEDLYELSIEVNLQ